MSTDKIRTYIQRTKMEEANNNLRYVLYMDELQVFYEMIMEGRIYDAIGLSFLYGKAKGYRMARRDAHD